MDVAAKIQSAVEPSILTTGKFAGVFAFEDQYGKRHEARREFSYGSFKVDPKAEK